MKTIKMILNTEAGRMAIESKLGEVQKRSKVRCISLKGIESVLERVDRELDIPESKMAGVKVSYTGAEKFPNAYKYRPESTHFHATHNGKTWVIDDIRRDTCPNSHRTATIVLTEAAKQAVIEAKSVLIC